MDQEAVVLVSKGQAKIMPAASFSGFKDSADSDGWRIVIPNSAGSGPCTPLSNDLRAFSVMAASPQRTETWKQLLPDGVPKSVAVGPWSWDHTYIAWQAAMMSKLYPYLRSRF